MRVPENLPHTYSSRIRVFLRDAAFRGLPSIVLRRLLQVHYLRKVQSSLESQEPDLLSVGQFVKAADHVIDVGANVGVYTIHLAGLVGKTGSVYSFEPMPLTFDILKYNVKKLRLSNVHIFNVALSDTERTAMMEIPPASSGGFNLYRSRIAAIPQRESRSRFFSVTLRTLDGQMVRQGARVSLLKIDVEGHELQVINGGKELIRRFRPAILIELSSNPDDKGSPAGEVCDRLTAQGYECYCINGGTLKRRSRGDKSVNYLFLTKDLIKERTLEVINA